MPCRYCIRALIPVTLGDGEEAYIRSAPTPWTCTEVTVQWVGNVIARLASAAGRPVAGALIDAFSCPVGDASCASIATRNNASHTLLDGGQHLTLSMFNAAVDLVRQDASQDTCPFDTNVQVAGPSPDVAVMITPASHEGLVWYASHPACWLLVEFPAGPVTLDSGFTVLRTGIVPSEATAQPRQGFAFHLVVERVPSWSALAEHCARSCGYCLPSGPMCRDKAGTCGANTPQTIYNATGNRQLDGSIGSLRVPRPATPSLPPPPLSTGQHFCATWRKDCPPSIGELPLLQDLPLGFPQQRAVLFGSSGATGPVVCSPFDGEYTYIPHAANDTAGPVQAQCCRGLPTAASWIAPGCDAVDERFSECDATKPSAASTSIAPATKIRLLLRNGAPAAEGMLNMRTYGPSVDAWLHMSAPAASLAYSDPLAWCG